MFLQLASYGLILFGIFAILMTILIVFWTVLTKFTGDPIEILKEKLGIKSEKKEDLQSEMQKKKGDYEMTNLSRVPGLVI